MYLPTDEESTLPHHKKKKNTKKWCKGKVGREHVLHITKGNYGSFSECKDPRWRIYGSEDFLERYLCWHQRSCKVCGKVLEWSLDKSECPDYPDYKEKHARPLS